MVHSTALCIVAFRNQTGLFIYAAMMGDFFTQFFFRQAWNTKKNQYLSRAEKMETRALIICDIRQIIIYFGKLGDRFDDVCLFPLMILRNNLKKIAVSTSSLKIWQFSSQLLSSPRIGHVSIKVNPAPYADVICWVPINLPCKTMALYSLWNKHGIRDLDQRGTCHF